MKSCISDVQVQRKEDRKFVIEIFPQTYILGVIPSVQKVSHRHHCNVGIIYVGIITVAITALSVKTFIPVSCTINIHCAPNTCVGLRVLCAIFRDIFMFIAAVRSDFAFPPLYLKASR